MLSQSRAQSPIGQPNLTPILESRAQYRSCHVCLPGENYRVAAVTVDNQYYSLVKVVRERQRSLEIANRLLTMGKAAVITKLAKGYAIWRLEPDAYTDACPRLPSQPTVQPEDLTHCKVLESRNEYQTCHISMTDRDKRLAAIYVDRNYYGLHKVVTTQEQALGLAARLQRKGSSVVITKTAQGHTVWVLEPDAVACED